MSYKNIHRVCEEYNIENYTINEDGSIDVDGHVRINYAKLGGLPLKFNKVSGFFDCSNNMIVSLYGAPKEVGLFFDCSNNKLISLDYAPIKVIDNFYCYDNSRKLNYEKYLKKQKRLVKLSKL